MDIQQFCDNLEGVTRYILSEPFVVGGMRIATDARIAVRVPTDEPETSGRKLPTFPSDWFGIGENSKEWPDVDLTEALTTCESCQGHGSTNRKPCESCNGEGCTICPECDHEHDCDDCDGAGDIGRKCGSCDGAGATTIPCLQKVDGVYIHVKYDRLIRPLEGVRYSVDRDMVKFIFDGGEGCVMRHN